MDRLSSLLSLSLSLGVGRPTSSLTSYLERFRARRISRALIASSEVVPSLLSWATLGGRELLLLARAPGSLMLVLVRVC